MWEQYGYSGGQDGVEYSPEIARNIRVTINR